MKYPDAEFANMIQGYPIYIGPSGSYGPFSQITDDAGKIFVGGIPADATKASLAEYFSQYGEVSDCILMVDNVTQRSRGFAFVTFVDPQVVAVVLNVPKHVINGKVVDCKKAVPKGPNQTAILRQMGVTSNRADRNPECKIFVGGVAQGTTESDISSYFLRFGKVLEVKIPKDQETQRGRGFAFVLFESPDCVQLATKDQYHRVNGKMVEVKGVNPQQAKPYQYDRNGERDSVSPYGNPGPRPYSPLNVYATPGLYTAMPSSPYYSADYLANYTRQLSLGSPGLYDQSPSSSTGSVASSTGFGGIPMQRLTSMESQSGLEYPNFLAQYYDVGHRQSFVHRMRRISPADAVYPVARPAYSMSPADLSGTYTPPGAASVAAASYSADASTAALYGTPFPTAYAAVPTPSSASAAQYPSAAGVPASSVASAYGR